MNEFKELVQQHLLRTIQNFASYHVVCISMNCIEIHNNRVCILIFFFFQNVFYFSFPAAPSQQTFGSGTTDPFADFNNDFMGPEFDEMDRDERIYNKFEGGLIKWEDRCLNVGTFFILYFFSFYKKNS